MRRTDVLVIGGGIAGYTAALTARRWFKDKKVTLVRREEKALIPWGLPYVFSSGTLAKNVIHDGRLFDRGIELIIDEVTDIDRKGRCVLMADSGRITYDKLILATGAIPAPFPVEGADLKGVFTVKREVSYLENLRRALDTARNLVIVGGGLTGVEFAEACSRGWRLKISVVELLPHCLSRSFDDDVCALAEERLRSRGINVLTKTRVEKLLGEDRVEQVKLSNGQTLPADVVILASGVVPNIELARKAGLEADERFGIWVDEYMRTSDVNIFAVGHCAWKSSGLAFVATRGARIAGANLFGLRRPSRPGPTASFTVVGDLALGFAGLTERAAREVGIGVVVTSERRSFDMPAAGELGMKVVSARDTGAIIGAQVYGRFLSRVREMTNSLAATIQTLN
ncbi:MAG: hypothetical protein PWP65_1857 [Clostridia bacterium]|nr:hypothetical protein [Clostridia bacterium]